MDSSFQIQNWVFFPVRSVICTAQLTAEKHGLDCQWIQKSGSPWLSLTPIQSWQLVTSMPTFYEARILVITGQQHFDFHRAMTFQIRVEIRITQLPTAAGASGGTPAANLCNSAMECICQPIRAIRGPLLAASIPIHASTGGFIMGSISFSYRSSARRGMMSYGNWIWIRHHSQRWASPSASITAINKSPCIPVTPLASPSFPALER